MNGIQVLDCTLRDGGYCNDWRFGFENAKKITEGLVDANIDIIECGFITNKTNDEIDSTKFGNFDRVKTIIPKKRNGKIFVSMINYGEYRIEDIPINDGSTVDGIRVAFHKKDLPEAMEYCRLIKEKKYLLFIQAMVSLNYSDEEFLSLIHMADDIKPYAFYIVDSFGVMKEKELVRMFYMVEHNLDKGVWIGYHSHNNMQLAYSNAQRLTKIETDRKLIIDSSIYGMGRGAGNLNTELFIEFLNENAGKNYYIKPILTLIDEILNEFYLRNYWGYSLPNYISASHNAHPNYASYLDDKKSLTVDAINDIFDLMEDDKKVYYDKTYIEMLYEKYMESEKIQANNESDLNYHISGKKVLLIAPGKSSIEEKDIIKNFVNKSDNLVVISINHNYPIFDSDFIFVSNLRRYRELKEEEKGKCIVTSNIPAVGIYCKTGYGELLNDTEDVSDNAGLMAIKLLIKMKAKSIYLAGFDGYTHDVNQNYGSKEMEFVSKISSLDAMNVGMNRVLLEFSKKIKIEFVTKKRLIGNELMIAERNVI